MKPDWPSLETVSDDRLREALGRMDKDLRAMLLRGLGAENFAWPIVQWTLTDGTEKVVDSPTGHLPSGFCPISAKNTADGTPLKITGWTFNDTLPKTASGITQIGITVSFGTASATGVVKCWLVGG
jgi:hypothetical protein